MTRCGIWNRKTPWSAAAQQCQPTSDGVIGVKGRSDIHNESAVGHSWRSSQVGVQFLVKAVVRLDVHDGRLGGTAEKYSIANVSAPPSLIGWLSQPGQTLGESGTASASLRWLTDHERDVIIGSGLHDGPVKRGLETSVSRLPETGAGAAK